MRFEQLTAVVARPVVSIVGRSIFAAVSFVIGMRLGGDQHLLLGSGRWRLLGDRARIRRDKPCCYRHGATPGCPAGLTASA